LTADERSALIHGWFKDMHCTLWGRSFDLIQNPEPAVKWFETEVQSFLDYVDAQATV